jgi:DNA topoisomerase-3
MITVIAEKPSVARDLAKVMGATIKGDGYIEGNGYFFTWAFGHLVQLAYPESYGYDGWKKESLPMLPSEFKLVIKQLKNGKELKNDPGAAKQLKVIKECFSKSSEIIVATDAGREGELIFRYIYQYVGSQKPFKRLWISSQTDKAIRDGFNSLKPGSAYDNLAYAAKSRSESDWLVGLNATQALSLSVGSGVYSLGRVQTPTLAMICQRYLDFKNFKPEIYYQLEIDVEKSGVKFTAISAARWSSKDEAQGKLGGVGKTADVVKVEKKDKTEPVPLLYDLTTLQQDSNKKFGYSAEKTLEIAQFLYESKFITYPRTGSRYIGEDVFSEVPDLIRKLGSHPTLGNAAKSLSGKKLNKRSVNAEKVTDHHALLVTENTPVGLDDAHGNVYRLIAGRMLEAFNESCEKELTTVELKSGELFIARGTVIKYAGWRGVFNDAEGEEGENDDAALPAVAAGDQLPVLGSRNSQKQTKPKPLHTEASLLKAMETCGREIEDEAAKEAMKDSGLGTPATRAAIIETLFTRSYIERQKKSLVPTEKGLAVYNLVKDKSISHPVMTGDWEKMLSQVEKGKMLVTDFMAHIKGYTKTLTEDLLSSGSGVKAHQEAVVNESLPKCPKCAQKHVQFVKNPKLDALVCSDRACGFIIFRTLSDKKLSDSQMLTLAGKGETGTIKGFISKSKKPFEAKLKISEEYKVVFVFDKK